MFKGIIIRFVATYISNYSSTLTEELKKWFEIIFSNLDKKLALEIVKYINSLFGYHLLILNKEKYFNAFILLKYFINIYPSFYKIVYQIINKLRYYIHVKHNIVSKEKYIIQYRQDESQILSDEQKLIRSCKLNEDIENFYNYIVNKFNIDYKISTDKTKEQFYIHFNKDDLCKYKYFEGHIDFIERQNSAKEIIITTEKFEKKIDLIWLFMYYILYKPSFKNLCNNCEEFDIESYLKFYDIAKRFMLDELVKTFHEFIKECLKDKEKLKYIYDQYIYELGSKYDKDDIVRELLLKYAKDKKYINDIMQYAFKV